MALAPVAAVLFQGNAVGEGGVELLVGLGETGRGDLGDRLDSRDDVGLGEPGVQALEGGGEATGEDGFLEGRAFWFQVFGREVGVAEGFQEFDRGVLGEVELVPAGGLGGHSGSGSGVTRSSPVRRTDMRADLTVANPTNFSQASTAVEPSFYGSPELRLILVRHVAASARIHYRRQVQHQPWHPHHSAI